MRQTARRWRSRLGSSSGNAQLGDRLTYVAARAGNGAREHVQEGALSVVVAVCDRDWIVERQGGLCTWVVARPVRQPRVVRIVVFCKLVQYAVIRLERRVS